MSFQISRSLTVVLLLAACPGGNATTSATETGGASTTETTTDEATTPGSTTAEPTTTTSAEPTGTTSTGATTTSSTGESTTGLDCSESRLIARWEMPEPTKCFGIAMDDSQAITVLAGESNSDSYRAELHRFVDGEPAWSVVHPPQYSFVRPFALAVRGDGVAVIAGFAADPTPGSFEFLPWTAAYDATGALLWEHIDSTNMCDSPPCRQGRNQGVVVTADGEFLVAGERGLYKDFAFDMTGVLRRYDAAMGEIDIAEFPMPYNFDDDMTKGLALRADGGVVMVGQSSPTPIQNDLWVARLAADGALEAIDTLDLGKQEEVEHVAALSDGSIVITGITDIGGDFFAARLDAALTMLWSEEVGWYGQVVAGADDAVFAATEEYRIVEKFTADGNPQWADDPCLEGDGSAAIGLSPDGAQLLVCRTDDEVTVVEIYDAT
ncbi:hypothetical protein [Nannocystis punicea]|uniref:Uncharacterized protein n=1 Tax=Nannocystis punicea TaxID=2995304 RepID=A0ABY7H5R5_9BACT|nr:hypothetical protein [Nannocystis poenicansa]WAS94537.1 hypothetical protein O0S08_00120 [Nannocystis poenicansa]